MKWWDYAIPVCTFAASVGLAGLMGAWAAERRLDRRQASELYLPPVVCSLCQRDSVATDEAEARDV